MSNTIPASHNARQTNPVRRRHGWILIAVALAGFGVGWLIGLSTSPVIASVIAALVGAATALFAGIAKPGDGADEPNPDGRAPSILGQVPIDPWPLAVLVIGLVIGSTIGVIARTHNWLGVDAKVIVVDEEKGWLAIHEAVDEWTELTGKPKGEVATILFEHQYLANADTAAAGTVPVQLVTAAVPGVLNAVPVEECRTLRNADESEILGLAKASLTSEVFKLSELVTDTVALKYVIVTFVCPE